jgi:hypothetical protein
MLENALEIAVSAQAIPAARRAAATLWIASLALAMTT